MPNHQPTPETAPAPPYGPEHAPGTLSPEQIDVIHEQLLSTLETQDNAAVTAQTNHILSKNPASKLRRDTVDVWKSESFMEAKWADSLVDAELRSHTGHWAHKESSRDIFESIAIEVAKDFRGSTDPSSRSTAKNEDPDFATGSQLADIIGSDALRDPHFGPQTLSRTEDSLRLLISLGLYKFHKHDNPKQLHTAINLMELFALNVPGFNIEDAGFEEARKSLIKSRAALQSDEVHGTETFTKLRPERPALAGHADNFLAGLRSAAAFSAIHANFDLVAPQAEAPETPQEPAEHTEGDDAEQKRQASRVEHSNMRERQPLYTVSDPGTGREWEVMVEITDVTEDPAGPIKALIMRGKDGTYSILGSEDENTVPMSEVFQNPTVYRNTMKDSIHVVYERERDTLNLLVKHRPDRFLKQDIAQLPKDDDPARE